MRLFYAVILITGFQLPQWWYAVAIAVWIVPMAPRLGHRMFDYLEAWLDRRDERRKKNA